MSNAYSQDSSAFSRRDFLTATGIGAVAALASPVSGASAPVEARAVPPDDGKLRIICFGAHCGVY